CRAPAPRPGARRRRGDRRDRAGTHRSCRDQAGRAARRRVWCRSCGGRGPWVGGILGCAMQKPKAAAKRLLEAHERREHFVPLPPELAPRDAEEAYAIQDAYVARRAERLGAIAGYKIALSSREMQRFVGVDAPQAGVMLASTLHRTPASVRAGQIESWGDADLPAVRGVATINGRVVGEGVGAAAMGHPLEAVTWIANHLAAHGRGLVFRDVVITGSIITTKTVETGDLVRF